MRLNKKSYPLTIAFFILSLLLISLIFFAIPKIIQFQQINREIINFLRQRNFEEAIDLISYDDSFKKYFSFLPVIREGLQLRESLKNISQDLEKINDGFLLSAMLQDREGVLPYLSSLYGIKENLNYLDKYGIDYIEDRKHYLENWLSFLGDSQAKNYLVLFQEPAIPRSTGGFLGAYAFLSLDKGRIDFSGDIIFALEEIFLERIIPPYPFQYISDKWFFHNSNWFFDFPSSSQKTLAFYSSTEKRPLLDGVILVNPSVLEAVLEQIGSINIEDYNLVIDQHNYYSFFKSQIQERAKPAPLRQEQDFFSVFLEALQKKLKKTSPEILSSIPGILTDSFTEKEIQIYVTDDNLEYFFDSFHWTGRIEESKGDYLAVVFNFLNQDFSEDNREKTIQLETEFVSDGQIINTLIISASSSSSEERRQESYLKIYLPKGINIKEAGGGYLKKIKDVSVPYLTYQKLGYKEDDDLSLMESTKIRDEKNGVEIYEEGGKTVVAAWTQLSIKPFTLVYKLPLAWTEFAVWELKAQKQSGQNIKFSYQLITPEEVKMVPSLFPFGQLVSLNHDLVLNFKREN